MTSSPLDFIQQHKVFRLEELQATYRASGRSEKAAREALKYHLSEGRICRVRKGVYAHAAWVDPYVIAAKLAAPAIISHDGALSFHELTGVGNSLTFMTTERTSVARHDEIIYQPLRVDESRIGWANAKEHQREGQTILVTAIEATLVDCLAVLAHSPPLKELMEAFKSAKRRAKPSAMINHALLYGSPLLCARLGFFLTCADLYVDAREHARLRAGCSGRQAHFQRSKAKESDRYFPPWELIVPRELYAFLPGV